MQLPDIRKVNIEGKKVFLRLDTDVPLSQNQEIEDDTRLKAGMETIEYLLGHGATIIAAGHLGRPGGKVVEELSLEPVAKWFAQHVTGNMLHVTREQIGDFDGWKLTENFSLLENLRFYESEEKNDPEFAKKLSDLADLYAQDSFGVCHRTHASVVGIPKLLPHFAGVHLQEEVRVLSQLLEHPERPLVVIIGGKKLETKLPLVEKMETFADHVLVGGKLANELKDPASIKVMVAMLTDDRYDITKDSIEKFIHIIGGAQTIVWNGPLGFVEEGHDEGTKHIAEAILHSQAYKVVGGGDTIEYLQRVGLLSGFDFVSTGGGAMLAFLSGDRLPGLEILQS